LFYQTDKRDHGLPHDPFKAIVAPRPIGWISSISLTGKPNLAPYSFFNGVSTTPDMVAFASSGWKDSAVNIRDTGEFACNYVSQNLGDAMNITSAAADRNVNEFELAGLEMAECRLIKPPRVKIAVACLECRLTQIVDLNINVTHPGDYLLIVGEVVGVHMDDNYIVDGIFDVSQAKPITRMGYHDYGALGEVFQITRPNGKDD